MKESNKTDKNPYLSDQLQMLVNATPVSLFSSVGVAVLVVVGMWGVIDSIWLDIWAAYIVCICLGRYFHVRRYPAIERSAASLKNFKYWYLAGVTLSGFGWGFVTAFLSFRAVGVYQILLPFVFACVTSSSVLTYSALNAAVRCFVLAAIVPPAALHFFTAGQAHLVTGALLLGYLFFLVRLGSIMHESLRTTFELRYAKEDLINEISAAKSQAEEVNQRLQQEISVRCETETRLRDAVAKAEQAAGAKSEFLATMSHEIRTPMNGVLGMTELIMNTELTPKQFRFADTIRRSGEGLLAIINDILDFSKIEAGKMKIQHTVFDLRQLAEDSVSFFAEQAHRKGLEVVLIYPPGSHTAYRGDPDRIRQILMNLIGNALKFTERGEICLEIKALHDTGDQSTLRFEITDTGVGIAEDHQNHIFDSFQQADGSTTRRFGGTGLGLAICNRLANLMNGEIGVTSTPGKGSTFWFTAVLSNAPSDLLSNTQKETIELKGSRVLVVDDSATNREVIQHQLENWGMLVNTTNSPRAAFKTLKIAADQNTPYDLVVADRQLPDISGIELARKIKATESLSNIRIIMLSSVHQLEDTGQWILAGIDSYLNKPIRQFELLETLGKSLRNRTSEGSQTTSAATTQIATRTNLHAHILIAEDNAVNQTLACAMLDALGCTYVVVENGREAIEAIVDAPLDAVNKPYDMVLMDCQMPDVDGYQATQRIRAWEIEQETQDPLPIVAVTANALEGDREKCLDAGMSDFLTKPFTQSELSQIISRWIKLSVALTADEDSKQRAASQGEQTQSSHTTKLDPAAIQNLRALEQQGSPGILEKIAQMFMDSAPKLMEKLQVAAATGNADQLRNAAHSLKSSSANLGAMEFSSLCMDLETMGRNNELSDALAKVGVLEFEFDAVESALAELISQEAAA